MTDETKTFAANAKKTLSSELINQAVASLLRALSKADVDAAKKRLEKLKADNVQLSKEALADYLIKKTVQQTAMVGVASSSAGLIPGIGTVAALTVGLAADISATFKLQAEMVLELALLYDYPLSALDQQKLILLVTGVSMGSNALLNRAGRTLSQSLAERYATKALAKALPFIGVAVSGSTNALATYVIAHRAKAFFQGGTDKLLSWQERLRRLSGFDERKLSLWLREKVLDKDSPLDAEVAELKAGLLEPERAEANQD